MADSSSVECDSGRGSIVDWAVSSAGSSMLGVQQVASNRDSNNESGMSQQRGDVTIAGVSGLTQGPIASTCVGNSVGSFGADGSGSISVECVSDCGGVKGSGVTESSSSNTHRTWVTSTSSA